MKHACSAVGKTHQGNVSVDKLLASAVTHTQSLGLSEPWLQSLDRLPGGGSSEELRLHHWPQPESYAKEQRIGDSKRERAQ